MSRRLTILYAGMALLMVNGCSQRALLRTGQTTCYNSTGAQIACSGTGQDGDLKKGWKLRYTDNGDGTVTDDSTGLMWELLYNNKGIHGAKVELTWRGAFEKVRALNDVCFAGHCDWRLPNVRELQSLIHAGRKNPSIDPIFGDRCVTCVTSTCVCTQNGLHWSSTTNFANPETAWVVELDNPYLDEMDKPEGDACVRAVRGGD